MNVSFSDSKSSAWTSLSGTATLVADRDKMAELWSTPLNVWFPDGLETEGIILIKVHAESAQWWESSSSKVVQLIGAARAAIGQDPVQFPGGSGSTEL